MSGALRTGLAGQTALVTGGGRGLGRAIAIAFARAGAAVWITARTESEMAVTADLVRRTGGHVEVVRADVSTIDGCDRIIDAVLGSGARLGILVNNAAVLEFVPVGLMGRDLWARTLTVNLTAPFLLTKAFLPQFQEHGGSIINVSSRAGVLGFADEAAYCASKFGLEGFTRALALELAGSPVSANTVTPGLRIKPTSVTEADLEHRPGAEREQWHDPAPLMPAFVLLAGLRGEVSGLRFDAFRVAAALGTRTSMTPADLKELAE